MEAFRKLKGALLGAHPRLKSALLGVLPRLRGALSGAPLKLNSALLGAPPRLKGALLDAHPDVALDVSQSVSGVHVILILSTPLGCTWHNLWVDGIMMMGTSPTSLRYSQ